MKQIGEMLWPRATGEKEGGGGAGKGKEGEDGEEESSSLGSTRV